MHESPRARLVAYGVSVLAPAVTLLVRRPLWLVLGDRVQYMAFFPAIMIAAYLGGFVPGLLATLLSALAASYFLVDRLYSFEFISGPDAVETRELALSFAQVLGQNPNTRNINYDWNETAKVIKVEVDQDRARALGLSSQQLR